MTFRRDSKPTSFPPNSSPIQSSKSTKLSPRDLLDLRISSEKDAVEFGRLLSTLGFSELPSNEGLERKNLITKHKREIGQRLTQEYQTVARGLLIDGLINLKKLDIGGDEGFPFHKRSIRIDEIIKPPKLDANVMGMGIKGNLIEKVSIPISPPLGGLNNLSQLIIRAPSSSTCSRDNLTMSNAAWLLLFLPNLKEAKINARMEKRDAEFLDLAQQHFTKASKVKVLELDCLVISTIPPPPPPLTSEIVGPTATGEKKGEIPPPAPKETVWRSEEEKAASFKNFFSLTGSLIGLKIAISYEPVKVDADTNSTTPKPTQTGVIIETLRKGLINSLSTLKSLSLEGIVFPNQLKAKYKSPFVAFVNLETLSIDSAGLNSLEPPNKYPNQLLFYFPPKLKTLELLANIELGGNSSEIPYLKAELKSVVQSKGKGKVKATQSQTSTSTPGLIPTPNPTPQAHINGHAEEGEEEEDSKPPENKTAGGKKKKKKKSKAKIEGEVNGDDSTTPIPIASTSTSNLTPPAKASPSKTKSSSNPQDFYNLESRIVQLLLHQFGLESPNSHLLPKNFTTLISFSKPTLDKNHDFVKYDHQIRLENAESRRLGKEVKELSTGQKETRGAIRTKEQEIFLKEFERERKVSRGLLKRINGGMKLIVREREGNR